MPAIRPNPEPANGILARVPGDIIAQGSRQLPAPQKGDADQVATVQVPDIGKVRITYRANTFRHGRSARTHWLAVRADVA